MWLGVFLKEKDEIQTLWAIILQNRLITQILNSASVELQKKNNHSTKTLNLFKFLKSQKESYK